MAPRKSRLIWLIPLLALVWLTFCPAAAESAKSLAPQRVQAATTPVSLRAQSGREIEFRTQNGQVRYGADPEVCQIPQLTLYRNQTLTEPAQRTLEIQINGMQLPAPGATVSLWVETQAGDPDATSNQGRRIPVWSESIWVTAHPEGNIITFQHTFQPKITANSQPTPTPTGYFRYEIRVEANRTLLYTFEREYAFLLENEWLAQLPEVPEETAGAAPDELVIYYSDLTPFQKDIHNPETWVARAAVRNYVGYELAPAFIEAFRLQSIDWGFIWHAAWTGWRGGVDAERLSVALTDGRTWYHGEAAARGNASISINVAGGENDRYATLTDGLLSTLQHELFHNLQRSLNQHYGGAGWVGGRQGQWQFIAEGTAVLASAVAQPEIQFGAEAGERAYFANANLYLGSATIRSDIGREFSEISPYHAALYWRFLFEQCGGLNDAAAGMGIVREILAGLYRLGGGDGSAAQVLGEILPEIVDQAVGGSRCRVQSYNQSLAAFARAIEALAVPGGRCTAPSFPADCGFYDPHGLYNQPPVNAMAERP